MIDSIHYYLYCNIFKENDPTTIFREYVTCDYCNALEKILEPNI